MATHEFEIDDAALLALGADALPDSLANAALKRRIEFLAGRHCARAALRDAGFSGHAGLAIGADRAPQWPAGWVGTITHSHGVALAAAAPAALYRGIGLDVERWVDAERAAKLAGHVALDAEWARCPVALSSPAWFTLVFSMKESLFKALYPQVGRYFGFHDAEVVEADAGEAVLQLVNTLSPQHPAGSAYRVQLAHSDDFALTLCTVPTAG
ncbi:4'-phosphopantetheinyl transferase [Jeongeupia sp. HS-3]|uniref:4'-phosphopantetheinyl transferase family protein n=1 Tax=Jeongeupia sp. HS-3 TaxID=1009682 RepID=UPI0019108081|nr:4'-phosphopantetheinyl transferase superfamily protein [Jeongeupia sp. HS-3]